MKIFRSIRWRLQFWYGLFLALLLGGFGLTAYQVEHAQRFRRIDEELRSKVEAMNMNRRMAPGRDANPGPPPPRNNPPPPQDGQKQRPPEPPPQRQRPADPTTPGRDPVKLLQGPNFDGSDGFYYVIWMRNGPDITRSPAAPDNVPRPDTIEGGFRQRGEWREYFMVPAPDDFFLAGRSVAKDEVELRRFGWLLAGAGAGVLLVGLLGGWWVVSRAIKPIEDISTTAVKIAEGDLSQRIHVTSDGNELDQLADVLNSTFMRLDAAFAQQARFTADAAHELRTPVAVMLTHTQSALETACPADEHREAFEACQRAAQRMRRLIESLLQLARFDAGHEPLQTRRVDLAQVAGEAIELVEPLAAQRGITIHKELAAASIEGDADRLGQVITNLLSNAIHYNKEGGEVRVTTMLNEGVVVITIADNGPGIPPQHLPHIFERFYRADKARTSTEGRTGLGLAICRAIVEAHGGRIAVRSEAGEGAEFRVELFAQGEVPSSKLKN